MCAFSGEGTFLVASTAWLIVMPVSVFVPRPPPLPSPPAHDLKPAHVSAGVSLGSMPKAGV